MTVFVISDNITFDVDRGTIFLEKSSLSEDDRIAMLFAETLNELGVRYSVIAGYVAILFGRARRSDDIDFITYPLAEDEFLKFCLLLRDRGFKLMQGDIGSESSIRKVYEGYLERGFSIRFTYGDLILPNIWFKTARSPLQHYSIDNSLTVIVNKKHLIKIAPLELQIAYKLYLESEKDLGDAVFLYTLFRQALNHQELHKWLST
ncbi:MAG: hypothetical protein ACO2O2_03875, partial [Acidilobaceae archaeon]